MDCDYVTGRAEVKKENKIENFQKTNRDPNDQMKIGSIGCVSAPS